MYRAGPRPPSFSPTTDQEDGVRLRAATAQVHLLDGGGSSLAAILGSFLDTLDSPRTKTAYRRAVLLAFKIMRRGSPNRVSANDVAAFKRSQEGRAPATTALRLSALRAFFKYAVATGYAITDPTAHVPIPKVHATAPRALSVEQAKRIAAKINTTTLTGKRDALAIALLFSGLRVAEVAGLNVGDVQVLEQEGHTFTRVRVVGKGSKPREVDLPRRIHELVIAYVEARDGSAEPDTPLLLANVTGYRMTIGRMSAARIYEQFRKYSRRAKVKITGSHAARHSWARWAEDGGAKMLDICEHLGHASLATTQVYLRRLSGKRNAAYSHVPEVV